jgi:hypothetical protein
MSTVSDDELTAVSLMVATFGVLFGVWYGELRAAQSSAIPPNMDNRGPVITTLEVALRWRATPLAGGACLTATLGLPVVLRVVTSSVEAIRADKPVHYDAVSAFFVGSWVVLFGLAVVIAREYWLLRQRLKAARAT